MERKAETREPLPNCECEQACSHHEGDACPLGAQAEVETIYGTFAMCCTCAQEMPARYLRDSTFRRVSLFDQLTARQELEEEQGSSWQPPEGARPTLCPWAPDELTWLVLVSHPEYPKQGGWGQGSTKAEAVRTAVAAWPHSLGPIGSGLRITVLTGYPTDRRWLERSTNEPLSVAEAEQGPMGKEAVLQGQELCQLGRHDWQYVETDGPLGHGWRCSRCAEYQAG